MPAHPAERSSRSFWHRVGDAGARLGRDDISSRRGRRFFIQAAIVLLVFGFLAFAIVRQWNTLPEYDWHFSLGWLSLAGIAIFAYYVVQSVFWTLIVRFLGERLEMIPAQAIWGKSLLARYVPGNMLMIIGRVVMAERQGVSRRASISSVVYELGLTFCAAVIVASYFLMTLPSLSGTVWRWAFLAVVPIELFLLHPKVFKEVADFLLSKLGREPLPGVLPFRMVLVMVLFYCFSWVVMGLGSYAFVRAIFPLGSSHLPAVTASFALAWCVAVLTFISPSGLGTRDGAYALALKSVLPGAVAAAVAIGARIFQTAVEILYVAVAVTVDRMMTRRAHP